jgi:phage protein U
LVQAIEKKQLIESNELLDTVNQIITRANLIFERNFEKQHDVTALKALAEIRGTIQLLSNVSAQLTQSKLAEMELKKHESGESAEQAKQEYQQSLHIFSDEELLIFQRLVNKLNNQTTDKIISNGRVLVRNSHDKRDNID